MPDNKVREKFWIQWYDKATESIREEECYFVLRFLGEPPFYIFERDENGEAFRVDDLRDYKFLED